MKHSLLFSMVVFVLITAIAGLQVINSQSMSGMMNRYKPTVCEWSAPNGGSVFTAGCETPDPAGPCGQEVCCPPPGKGGNQE